jgi:elongin-C
MPKEFVKLISKEGFEFIVDYRAACISNTLKNMLSFDGVVLLFISKDDR